MANTTWRIEQVRYGNGLSDFYVMRKTENDWKYVEENPYNVWGHILKDKRKAGTKFSNKADAEHFIRVMKSIIRSKTVVEVKIYDVVE